MLCNNVRRRVSLFFVALLFSSMITWPGCGALPIVTGDISLSATKLVPGKLLSITHSSIVAGSTVTINFDRGDGFLVSVAGVDTEDGLVRVAVPALIDITTGQFQAGDVMVSIDGVESQQSLMIGELLQLDGIEPGAVLRLVLEAALEDYQSLLTNIGSLSTDLGNAVDTTASTAAINVAIQDLQSQLTELDTTGKLSVTLPDNTTTILGTEELAMADRLLVTLLAGVSSADSSTSKNTSTLGQKDIVDDCILGTNNPTDRIQCLKDVLGEIRVDTGKGTNMASMVGTSVGLVVTVFGAVTSSSGVALTGLLVAVVSVAASFGNAAINNQNSDSFSNNDRQSFDASQESASQFIRVGSEAASSLPGPVGITATVVNVGLAANDLYNGAESVKCDGSQRRLISQQFIADVAEFCPVTTPPTNDGSTTVSDDPSSADAITVIGFTNTDGFISSALPTDTSQAQIQISGDPTRPTISWTGVSEVFSLLVTSSTLTGTVSLLYGLEGETPPDENGNTEQVPFAFSSVIYGTFGLTNTVPQGGLSGPLGPDDAVNLTSDIFVSVSIFTLTGRTATLSFQVN